MSCLRTIIFAAGMAFTSALLLEDTAVADPPDWALTQGYRNKHHEHAHKHHRHKRDYDARYGYDRERDWRKHAYRDDEPYPYRPSRHDELRTLDQPLFVDGECTPKRVTGAEAGAALGSALGATMGGGNSLATVAGTLAGAMLGSKADAAFTTGADQDCFQQVLDRATDRQEVAWDNHRTSTHYELTPVRSYRQSGQACRELVTMIERHGEVREVYQTACRHRNGRWQLSD